MTRDDSTHSILDTSRPGWLWAAFHQRQHSFRTQNLKSKILKDPESLCLSLQFTSLAVTSPVSSPNNWSSYPSSAQSRGMTKALLLSPRKLKRVQTLETKHRGDQRHLSQDVTSLTTEFYQVFASWKFSSTMQASPTRNHSATFSELSELSCSPAPS